jgi:hypothetical protein
LESSCRGMSAKKWLITLKTRTKEHQKKPRNWKQLTQLDSD